VSSINTPLYPLATFLHNILVNNLPKADSYNENSFQLVDRLNSKKIDKNSIFISLGVISLFTNMSLDLAIECVSDYWNLISNSYVLPKDEFIAAIQLVLNSTFFKFNDVIYQQNYGTPMGSPLSLIIADLMMQNLERKAMKALCHLVYFYYRYVDDLVMSVRWLALIPS